ncbi:MAG: hypothetical protein LCH76_15135 [Actinobacteria bacterium]|nr:hypothetical protein [Actinomycetota bacterium]
MPPADAGLLAALDAISDHFPTVTALILEDDESNLIVYDIEQNPVPNLDNPDDPDYPFSEADINALIEHHLAGLQLPDLATAAATLQRNGHQVVINDTTAWIGLRPPPPEDPAASAPVTQTPLQAATARLNAANTELHAAYAEFHVQELAELARELRRDHPEAHSIGLIRWSSSLDDFGGNTVTTGRVFDQHGTEVEGERHADWHTPLAGGRFEASTAHITHTHPLLADALNDGDEDPYLRLDIDHILTVAETISSTTHPTGATQDWEKVPAPHHHAQPTTAASGPPTPTLAI